MKTLRESPLALRFSARKLTIVLFAIMSMLIIASLIGQYIQIVERDTTMIRVINEFNLDHERNIPTFFSTALLLFSSGLLLLIYSTEIDRSKQKYWLLLSIIFLTLSIDEANSVHEKLITPLRNLMGTSPWYYFAWIVPAAVLLAALGLLLLKFLNSLPRHILRLFLLSAAIYVMGVIGMELIGGYYVFYNSKETFFYTLLVSLEEGMEMSGVILFIYGLISYLKVMRKGELQLNFV